jgi:UDP-2,3-diacylglucosamine hydrolase
MRILPDPAVVVLYGQPTLIQHGDLLCTDDVAYQQFRAQTRDPAWQAQFLAQPLAARLAFAQQARAASKAHQSGLRDAGTMETITDVSPATVDSVYARYGLDRMIHGHTHRPAVHELEVAGVARQRVVLGDWYDQGSVLRVNRDGLQLQALS